MIVDLSIVSGGERNMIIVKEVYKNELYDERKKVLSQIIVRLIKNKQQKQMV